MRAGRWRQWRARSACVWRRWGTTCWEMKTGGSPRSACRRPRASPAEAHLWRGLWHSGRWHGDAKRSRISTQELPGSRSLMSLHPCPVPWIANLEPAIHGSWEGGASGVESIIDFSANGNVIGPPPGVRAAIAAAAIDRYPERTSFSLRRVLGEQHGLDPNNVVIGSGSTELIWALARAFLAPGSLSLVVAPTYGEYVTASRA